MRAITAVLFAAATSAVAGEEVRLLDFTAPYCGPCKSIKPHLDGLARQGYPIEQVDISKNPGLARQFGVKFVPTFVLLVNGRETWRSQGIERVGDLKGILDKARGTNENQPVQPIASAKADVPDERRPGLLERMFNRQTRETTPETPEVVLGQDPRKPVDSVTKGAMAASVRIRVTYDGKVQFGSGTIVQSKQGKTVILTCAHIMDQAGNDPKVQVDVFEKEKVRTFVGKIVGHDIKSDVGIITIPTSARLPVAELASPVMKLKKTQQVFSIGCNNGKPPTRIPAKLSGIDRYLGPNNLETDLAPENGRSGGALFDMRGRVIGVCSAADKKGNHGLYAGNRAIFDMFKKYKLLTVYGEEIAETPKGRRTTLFDSDGADDFDDQFDSAPGFMDGLADAAPFDSAPVGSAPAAPVTSAAATPAPVALKSAGSSFGDELGSPADGFPDSLDSPDSDLTGNAAIVQNDNDMDMGIPETIHQVPALANPRARQRMHGLGDAEVTVVIRPRDPRKPSQIVVIPKASSNFVAMLQGELDEQPIPTSFVRPVAEMRLRTKELQPTAYRVRTSQRRSAIIKLTPVTRWIDRAPTSDYPTPLTPWLR